ncbi:MAG: hypothetical protein K8I82_23630, partial [Anaerolineae bacterium]|nr:hypothetical protein [Anaerolineae bacterium]
ISAVSSGSDTFDFMINAAEQYLGCDPNLFTIEEVEFSVLLQLTDYDQPSQNRPHMWSLAWGPDYPDANNWVGDVISCYKDNNFQRPCTELDDLIEAAARELDPQVRIERYFEIEAQLFGRQQDGQVIVDGEFPFVPIALSGGFYLVQPWYEGPFATDGIIGGAHWDWRSVDQEMQLEARGR